MCMCISFCPSICLSGVIVTPYSLVSVYKPVVYVVFLVLLCRLILPTSLSPKHLLELAARGDNTRCDMLVKDIYGGSYQAIGLKSATIASTFGKLQHIPLKYLQGYALENNSEDEEEDEDEDEIEKEEDEMKKQKDSSAKKRRRFSPSFTNTVTSSSSSSRGTPHLPSSPPSFYRYQHCHCIEKDMLCCNISSHDSCCSPSSSPSSSSSCRSRVGGGLDAVSSSYPSCTCLCFCCVATLLPFADVV